jgi:phospholipase/carboxylesterase
MPQLPDAIEIETGENPGASVIWLHGLGADGYDFEPIVPELRLSDIPIRFVFPHAPMQPVTINAGMVMRAWYDVSDAAIRREDEAGVRGSQALLEGLITREKQRGSAGNRIVVAGFSQGGAIALQTGLRHAERLAGIMALSCYLPIADNFADEAHPANRDVPVFMGHGTQDPVVTLARAVESRELLERAGYRIEWHDYPMPHSVCMEEIRDIGAWLRRILG